MSSSTLRHRNPENTTEILQQWEHDSHPFYQLLAEFIQQNRIEPTPNPLSQEEIQEIWGDNPYDEIIIATGSVQKSFETVLFMQGIKPPFENPAAYQDFVSRHIYNGDGALREKIFLDYFLGVPVYAQSASQAETAANEPAEEAQNKVYWLVDQYQQQADGQRRFFVSTDAVDFANFDGLAALAPGEEGFGKPGNLPEYPGGDADQEALAAFDTWYKETFFLNTDETLDDEEEALHSTIHTNGVAIIAALADKDAPPEEVRLWQVVLRAHYDKQALKAMEVHPFKGGGGATQQFLDWDNPETVFAALDEETQAIAADLFAADPDRAQFAVMSQIVGAPIMNILHEIEQFAARQRGEEVVVFENQTQYSEER